MKKSIKKSKEKFGNMKKPPYLCGRNQTTNTPKGKKKISLTKKYKAMKQIVTDNAELLEVLTANGINILCSDDMKMMITDTDAIRIDAIVAEKAPAAFADYVIC